MSLPPERWRIRVLRLIQDERRSPFLYRVRILLLSVFACINLFLLLAGAVSSALAGGCIWLVAFAMSSIPHGIPPYVILAASVVVFGVVLALMNGMWITVPMPQGVRIRHQDAAPLLLEVERLCCRLRIGTIHQVVLTNDFNAGIKQVPRWGLFGGSHNYLVLGIPLMSALTPEQFRAVVAHELGHLAGGHGRFSSWIYQLNASWVELLAVLGQEDRAQFALCEGFLDWFAPLFSAYTFPVRRGHEYCADRAAAGVVTPESVASALIATHLTGRALLEGHSGPLEVGTAQRWLNDALAEPSNLYDVHPSLSERLRSLGQKPFLPVASEESALAHFLGYKAERLTERVDVCFGVKPRTAADPAEDSPAASLRPIGS